jgi:hypothetical protein
MTSDQRKAIQRELKEAGHYDGEIDGDFGPRSRRAAQTFLRSLCPHNPWPKQANVREFYGEPGEDNLISFDFPYPMFYDGKLVTKSRCHKKVRDSLLRVLTAIKPLLPNPDVADEAQDYGGIYNFRPKRGASSLSMHAWGIAIDLDADDNSFKLSWPVAADMHWEIIKAFAREGWTSAAVHWGYDAMHFQATAA